MTPKVKDMIISVNYSYLYYSPWMKANLEKVLAIKKSAINVAETVAALLSSLSIVQNQSERYSKN